MEWYPTPSYLVKRRVILEFLTTCDGKNILEVGCGCGDLLHVLDRRGYSGLGIDISEDALGVAGAGLSSHRIKVARCTPGDLQEKFDIVIASEVMEHYQDDEFFLLQLWERLLDGGHVLLTVPAHMKDWGPNDDFCGHVRRYERTQLYAALKAAGFDDIVICSYGVPIYNVMKPFYDWAIRTETAPADAPMEKTAESGGMWLMKGAGRLFRILFNDLTMYPMYVLQRLFYSTDLGKGYFAIARKKEQK
ncbi:MAG: class I SAM-dependent methyltransferase [Pelobacteraceae bacterium]